LRKPDDAEFQDFVSERLDDWRRAAFLLSQNWHDADDLVSIAVMKLYRSWNKVRRADNWDAYARTVLTRCWLSERRRAHVRRELLSAEPLDGPSLDPFAGSTDRLTLNDSLRGLGAGQRTVLALRYYLDCSVEETATLLGISTGTVKSQSSRGLDTLRADLHPSYPKGRL
jgi:RNA polymerase sigma-70 factor (sigma-E family)